MSAPNNNPPQTGFSANPKPTPYNPNYTAPRLFGKIPQSVICQNCNSSVVTVTNTVNGLTTWLLVAGIALVGCICGCCLIPLCIQDVKDVEHHW